MPKHKVYVTRDASVTYVAEVDMPLEEIKERCGKHGFACSPELEWETFNVSAYDNAEVYEVTEERSAVIGGKPVVDEVIVWSKTL